MSVLGAQSRLSLSLSSVVRRAGDAIATHQRAEHSSSEAVARDPIEAMASSSRGGQISRAEKLDRDLDVVEISDDETHHSAPPPPKRVRHTIRPSAFGSTPNAA